LWLERVRDICHLGLVIFASSVPCVLLLHPLHSTLLIPGCDVKKTLVNLPMLPDKTAGDSRWQQHRNPHGKSAMKSREPNGGDTCSGGSTINHLIGGLLHRSKRRQQLWDY
jgi:hypothetical protein